MPAQKWYTCNGQQLRKLALASLVWLEKHHQHVNSLNVFPVPDGDTGTNMLLTMRSAYKRIRDTQEMSVGKVSKDLSQGALMGARGNSGVILSQIWRGMAKSLDGKDTFGSQELAQAFVEAADTAYKGVMKPVEGTILTVIREASLEAVDAARKSNDLRFVLERTLERAQLALENTPEQLPVLKQAGVVDSGGMGLVYILEGMLRYTTGDTMGVMEPPMAQEPAVAVAEMPAQARVAPQEGVENPYDVQFILMGKNLDVLEVRAHIDAMGDSTVVVGDDTTIKVHIHVKDPGIPLSYGISLGHITDVVVENMQMQMEEIIAGGSNEHPEPALALMIEPEKELQPGQIGVIAVAPGPGLANVFRSLGVANVVDGGQTNNPSTEEIFQAIQDVPTDKVVLLPNNKNIILAAETARDLSPKNVVVVPTVNVPQGVSALFAYQADGDLEDIATAMRDASAEVSSGEITTATRTVSLDGVDVQEGNYIGLANGRLCAAADTLQNVVAQTLDKMGVDDCELLSVYYGKDVSAAEAEAFSTEIQALHPDLEIELVAGGQPHYFFILGAE
ncbi:MAG: DAK2 domain-containing protein [Ardenticatenales bacterium]|nr:DAK2 domain-containing protein [Ardenticatenales bacterium]